MAQEELVMPKMGESIIEATILNWVKNVGDTVEVDETILEIATDKVDSEIPSPYAGKIVKILHDVDEVVEIGKVIAIIETDADSSSTTPIQEKIEEKPAQSHTETSSATSTKPAAITETIVSSSEDRFYSPLVKNIAKEEGIDQTELDSISGSGLEGRVTKSDILAYVKNQSTAPQPAAPVSEPSRQAATVPTTSKVDSTPPKIGEREELIKMTRMRKVIADHMVMSKHTSPHVTSFVEVDVTDIVNWREKNKVAFQKKHGEKITYTPIFMEAIVKAIQDFPGVNVSLKGDQIIQKNYINLGMATALPSGDLIVPVIKDADNLSLLGLSKSVNDLARRARANKLSPDEIQGGTFTVTNVGTFGNVMGTPIINQPQVAIMAVGAIRKKPAVVETEYGDLIAVRHMMYLSMSYDHRVVDGMLGGTFLRKVGDYIEAFDDTQTV